MSWWRDVPALSGLSEGGRRRLDALVPMQVAPGTVLFRPGEAVKGYVIVLQGRIGVHLVGPTGRGILLYDVVPGKSCIQSTLGLMGGDDYTAEAVAEEPSRAVLMPRATFLALLEDEPAFRAGVFAAFAERMQSMMHLIERVAFQKVEARLALWLLSRADAEGRVEATQQDIATAIGSAREVVSRRLEALSRQGAVVQERGVVTITDAAALRLVAESAGL